jgi:hypothetical protein
MHCRTRVGDDEHDVLRAVGVNVLDHQHGAVLRALDLARGVDRAPVRAAVVVVDERRVDELQMVTAFPAVGDVGGTILVPEGATWLG